MQKKKTFLDMHRSIVPISGPYRFSYGQEPDKLANTGLSPTNCMPHKDMTFVFFLALKIAVNTLRYGQKAI